eukprot:TRINITY_DN1436_c0_g1_i1.p1 TRINITY_DN1436_c0_g1~~TRINITY_DN1436_c0_g1_i1.p1  ORF type:complete len:631 (-),score=173.98 TRINITY_DN1436_c0_g1_i1:40-1932(-)
MLSLALRASSVQVPINRLENIQALLLADLATNVFLPHLQAGQVSGDDIMFWREVLKLERIEALEPDNALAAAQELYKFYFESGKFPGKDEIAFRLLAVEPGAKYHEAFASKVSEIETNLLREDGKFMIFLNEVIADLHGSWSRVQDKLTIEEFCLKFYERLYLVSPEMKRVFRDTKYHKDEMLIQVIKVAVPLLSRLDDALPELLSLGRRHGGYSEIPQKRSYDAMKIALLETISEAVGDVSSSEKSSWELVFEIMSGAMQYRIMNRDENNIVSWKINQIRAANRTLLEVSSNEERKSVTVDNNQVYIPSAVPTTPRNVENSLLNAQILLELDSRFAIYSDAEVMSSTAIGGSLKGTHLQFWRQVYILRHEERSGLIPRIDAMMKAEQIHDEYLARGGSNKIEFESEEGRSAIDHARTEFKQIGEELRRLKKARRNSADNSAPAVADETPHFPVSALFDDCIRVLEREFVNGPMLRYFETNTELLATSWVKVREKTTSKQFSRMFYNFAFSLDNSLSPLFSSTKFTHDEMLISVVDLIVPLLSDLGNAVSCLVRLGERHRRYGASKEGMDVMGLALVMSLKKVLEAEGPLYWNDQVERAWKESFKILSGILLKAMRDDELYNWNAGSFEI